MHPDVHSYTHKREQGPSLITKKVSLCWRFLRGNTYFVGSMREHYLPPACLVVWIEQQMRYREGGRDIQFQHRDSSNLSGQCDDNQRFFCLGRFSRALRPATFPRNYKQVSCVSQ
jgi:hypothetical protein